MPDFTSNRDQITNLVAGYGTAALLRRTEGDRPCLIFISSFSPIEMLGRGAEPMTRRVRVAITPEIESTPPDFQQDRLITLNPDGSENENLTIIEPATPFAPAGQLISWHLAVRR